MHWISHVISQAEARGAKEVEVSLAGEKEWTDHHVSVATLRQGFYDTCTPGYYTLEGQANKRNPKNLGYGLGTIVYGEKLAAYIKEGQLKGLELNGAQGTAVRASL